jgi:hypothetical protein
MDSSCYRLSRVPQKFNVAKTVKSETSESFAVTYYSTNPVDTRPPPDKLEEVESKLGEKVDDDEKFTLLVQKRGLCQMIYGENSPECIRATTQLASFYNEHGKPDSANRNLNKAVQSSKQTDLSEEDAFGIAVESADANLHAAASAKSEKSKQITAAADALHPYLEYESESASLKYRRDLCMARIRSFRNRCAESLEFYEKAVGAFSSVHEGETDSNGEAKDNRSEEANLYVETAQVAEQVEGKLEQAQIYYQKAFDLFEQLESKEDCENIGQRLEALREEIAANEAAGGQKAPEEAEAEGDVEEYEDEEEEEEEAAKAA